MWCFGFFLFKQKTAYEMRISDWSSDVCSSDLQAVAAGAGDAFARERVEHRVQRLRRRAQRGEVRRVAGRLPRGQSVRIQRVIESAREFAPRGGDAGYAPGQHLCERSEEHTTELQSLMRNSYDVFCLQKKKHMTKKK